MLKSTHKKDHHRKYKLRKQWDAACKAYYSSMYLIEVEPYQSGWVRYMVLNPDAIEHLSDEKRRGLQEGLELVQHYQYAKYQDFRWNASEKNPKYMKYSLRSLFNPPKDPIVARHFSESGFVVKTGKFTTEWNKRWIYNKEHWLTLVTEPNIITHERRYNEEKKSEMDRLWNKMVYTGDYYMLWHYERYDDGYHPRDIVEQVRRKEITTELYDE
jgi:hypothetical protein